MKETTENKKKVLIVVRWPVGGIRTFLRYVYRNFDFSRWSFTIITVKLDGTEVLIDDLTGLDIRFILVDGIPADGSSGFLVLLKSVRKEIMRGDYDLVHSHGYISGMCAALPAFLKKLPHVMTSHETLHDKQFLGLRGKIRYFGMSLLFRSIDVVHSVSNDARENLLDYFPSLAGNKDKCIVIPNGIETGRFTKADSRNLRQELGLDEKIFLIGFFGRFMSPKGFRYLVESVEILLKKGPLPRQPLVLAFGYGGFVREEKLALRKRGLEGNFHFMPFTANIAETIKGLDVVAMPSLWEAGPLLPMEVLTCGIPLVCSDCIGLREVVKNTPAASVPKADASSLADALKQEMTIDRKEEFSIFSQRAADIFDVRDKVNSIIALYETMTIQTMSDRSRVKRERILNFRV